MHEEMANLLLNNKEHENLNSNLIKKLKMFEFMLFVNTKVQFSSY